MARPVEHQAALLLGSLGCNEPHIGPRDRLANGLCVCSVILLAFDVGLHVGRWHQSHGVAKCPQLARPMMRRGASLDADQAGRQLLEERQDVAPLQLMAEDHLAGSINAMYLEHRLGDVETDCRDRLHEWLLRIVGALTAPTSMALTCRVEEPSTASNADISAICVVENLTAIGG